MPDTHESIHSKRVYDWRYIQLFQLGYSPEMAELLAHTRIDLADVRSLRAQGCPLELVARILAGTSAFGEDCGEQYVPCVPEPTPTEDA